MHRSPGFIPIKSGFTLIETIVAMSLLALFFAAVSAILQTILTNAAATKVRAIALAYAQQSLEEIKNLPYVSVGTQNGIPPGPLPQEKTETINGVNLTVETSVTFVDDPFDGVTPQDTNNTDYKRITLAITWDGSFPSRTPLLLTAILAPKSGEAILSGGTLALHVTDALGEPVPNASVTIDNTDVTPAVHIQTTTDTNGSVILPGSPACVSCYHIQATKSGYSIDRTHTTSEVANPLQPPLSVLAGQRTDVSYSIDRLSTLTLHSVGPAPLYAPITNVQFTLRGEKLIGFTTGDLPVYKYTFSTNTGGSSVTISNLEWDRYTLLFTNSAHTLAGSNPAFPISLSPNSSLTIPFVAVPKANTSLLLLITDPLGSPLASASTTLTNQLGYNVTQVTHATASPDFGHTIFNSLTPGQYDVRVTLPGYQEATKSLEVNGNIIDQTYLDYVQ